MFLIFISVVCFVLTLLMSVYQGVGILNDLFCNWGLHTTSYKVVNGLLLVWVSILITWSVVMLCFIYSATIN